MYLDVAYCYLPSSMVCRSVCLSAKVAALIEMTFGLRTQVGPGNHVLDGSRDPPLRRGKFLGENGRLIVNALRLSVQRRLNQWVVGSDGPKES